MEDKQANEENDKNIEKQQSELTVNDDNETGEECLADGDEHLASDELDLSIRARNAGGLGSQEQISAEEEGNPRTEEETKHSLSSDRDPTVMSNEGHPLDHAKSPKTNNKKANLSPAPSFEKKKVEVEHALGDSILGQTTQEGNGNNLQPVTRETNEEEGLTVTGGERGDSNMTKVGEASADVDTESISTTDTNNEELTKTGKLFNIGDNNAKLQNRPNSIALFEPGEVLNVEISKQKEIGPKGQKGKPCKRVDGEAVERTHVRTDSAGCVYLNQEDTINSNMCWVDEDEEKIDFENSPPHSPYYREASSLFPAPQMNYPSIYSQDTVSISDMSFSEPENTTAESQLMPEITDATLIDSLSMLSLSSSELTDIEDNRCPTPPINLDTSGGVELTEAVLLRRDGYNSGKDSAKYSSCSSPSAFDTDSAMSLSSHSMAEKVSERLRLLADSWADIPTPNCGYIQSITVTDTLVWAVDSHDHMFTTPSCSASVNWKKMDGKARQLSANQSGTIVWNVNRKKAACYRLNIKPNLPQGISPANLHAW